MGLPETADSLWTAQKYAVFREGCLPSLKHPVFHILTLKNFRGKEWKAKLVGRQSFHFLTIFNGGVKG